MKKFNNRYIFFYITALALTCIVLLTVVSVSLQSRIRSNKSTEMKIQILSLAHYHPDKRHVSELFHEVASEKKFGSLAYYEILLENNAEIYYVFPMRGQGLWGPIWGYLSVKNDGKTVTGIALSHKGETPGLGAEISGKAFCQQFIGKKLIDKNYQFTSIEVVKGGYDRASEGAIHQVDAITGGTITCNAVDEMLHESLLPYETLLLELNHKFRQSNLTIIGDI